MDRLRLYKDPSTPYGGVDIYVNDRLLRMMLMDVELPAATADGCPELAGAYMGPKSEEAFLPGQLLLGTANEHDDFFGTGKVTLLDCQCGNPGCSPMGVRIVVDTDRVTWSEFELFRGGFGVDYSMIGPFIFDRTEYMQQLDRDNIRDQ